jgi:hypothetical protein
MMRTPLPIGLALAVACLLPLPSLAQSTGGPVPEYVAPAPAPAPARTGEVADRVAKKGGVFSSRPELINEFRDAYQRNKKPRLAFFWNRQLSDTLNQWYGDQRLVVTDSGQGSVSGDLNLEGSGNRQRTIEAQSRVGSTDKKRMQPSENWEWEFQDGFLSPFLESGAAVIDRTAILRITGAKERGVDDLTIETRSLQGMADYLVEVLVAPTSQSPVGDELRARILDVQTGRILAYVNSRSLKDWNQKERATATSSGFELNDEDEDETFGPRSTDRRYQATSSGFERRRKPPKLKAISENLAYNVMTGMMKQWP